MTRFRWWLAGVLWSWSALLYDGMASVSSKDASGGPNGR